MPDWQRGSWQWNGRKEGKMNFKVRIRKRENGCASFIIRTGRATGRKSLSVVSAPNQKQRLGQGIFCSSRKVIWRCGLTSLWRFIWRIWKRG